MGMCLNISGDEQIEDPTEAQVRAAIDALDERDENPFVILDGGPSGSGFIQALGGPYAFLVEYKDASTDRQYRAAVHLPKEIVHHLFAAYLRSDPSYVDGTEWEDVTEELSRLSRQTRQRRWNMIVVLVLLVLGIILAIWVEVWDW